MLVTDVKLVRSVGSHRCCYNSSCRQ